MTYPQLDYQLNKRYTATVNASGVAEIRCGPERAGERWIVTGMASQSTSTNTSYTPLLHVRRQGYELIAGTYNPRNDTSSGDNIELLSGQTLQFMVTAEEPGATITINVTGRGYAI